MIFEKSRSGRINPHHFPPEYPNPASESGGAPTDIPERFLRTDPPDLPAVSELQVVRHYTRLSQKNFSVDTHFYPLGSCTMKYNPKAADVLSRLPGFLDRHPLAPPGHSQGVMACLYELQEYLKAITGMAAVSLAPLAGAQGEFAGVAMIRAYHEARGDEARRELLIPDAAHGTNPATATLCGYTVREIPTDRSGNVALSALEAAAGPRTAGIMLTNPSTLGLFEANVHAIAETVHGVGGLLYYDGANLNAILGKARPGDMGFDVAHVNLHKTFATPHGGGGPGAGPVAANGTLAPYLPTPMVVERAGAYYWRRKDECPLSIGPLGAFAGNALVALRAYVYLRLLGREGLPRVAEFAVLNANYLAARLRAAGFDLAYPERRACHEFTLSLRRQAKAHQATAQDFAKRLLDYGFHAPTTYFPQLVAECLLIEPTETESKEELDGFVAAMRAIAEEAATDIERLKGAPYRMPVRRPDEVKAARDLDVCWSREDSGSPEVRVETDAE